MHIDLSLVKNILDRNFSHIFLDCKDYILRLNGKSYNCVRYKIKGSEAFDFAYITGAAYMLTKHGFFLNGSIKFFRHRNYNIIDYCHLYFNPFKKDLELQSCSTVKFIQEYPDLLVKDKELILLEYDGESNIEPHLYEYLKSIDLNPNMFLLYKINNKTYECLEGFLEYIACKSFINLGYYVENQSPWSYHGRPDFIAYKHPVFGLLEKEMRLIQPMLLNKLSLLKVITSSSINNKKANHKYSEYEILVGEAKIGQKRTQLEKYLGLTEKNQNKKFLQIADYGFEVILDKEEQEGVYSGLINIDKNFDIRIFYPKRNNLHNLLQKNEDLIWLIDYIKGMLLYNFDIDEVKHIFNTTTLSKPIFIEKIKKIDVRDILKII